MTQEEIQLQAIYATGEKFLEMAADLIETAPNMTIPDVVGCLRSFALAIQDSKHRVPCHMCLGTKPGCPKCQYRGWNPLGFYQREKA